jgi:phospholipase A1
MTRFPRTCFSPRARCRLAAWSLIATAGSAWAQEPASPGPVGAAAAPAAEALAACAGEDDPGRRLACFDALVPPRATASLAQALPQPVPARAALPTFAPSLEASPLTNLWAIGIDDAVFDIQAHRPTYVLPVSYTSDSNDFPASPTRPGLASGFGWDDLEAKFQLSFKFKLADLEDSLGASLWAGYTQQSYWQVYNAEESRPFRETNYEPELMLAFHPDREVLGLDWRLMNFGLVHQSNGRAELLSRSWNRVYAQAGFEKGGFALLARGWLRFSESAGEDDNPDIEDYLGHGDLVLSYVAGNHHVSLLGRYAYDTGHGAVEASWSFPLSRRVRGYVQVFSGYGEQMLDYNWKQTTVGVGISLADWF